MKIKIVIYIFFYIFSKPLKAQDECKKPRNESFAELSELIALNDALGDRYFVEESSRNRHLLFGSRVSRSCLSGLGGQERDNLNFIQRAFSMAMIQARRCYERFGFPELLTGISVLRRTQFSCTLEGTAGGAIPIPDGNHSSHQLRYYPIAMNMRHVSDTSELDSSNLAQIKNFSSTLLHEALHHSSANNRHNHNQLQFSTEACGPGTETTDRVIALEEICFGLGYYQNESSCPANCTAAFTESDFVGRGSDLVGIVGGAYAEGDANIFCNRVGQTKMQIRNLFAARDDLLNSNRFERVSTILNGVDNVLLRNNILRHLNELRQDLSAISSFGMLNVRFGERQAASGINAAKESLHLKIKLIREAIQEYCRLGSGQNSLCNESASLAIESELERYETFSQNYLTEDLINFIGLPSIQELDEFANF